MTKAYKDMTKDEQETSDMEYFTKKLHRGLGITFDYEAHRREDNERIQ